jgi:hypothetical protein
LELSTGYSYLKITEKGITRYGREIRRALVSIRVGENEI